MAHLDKSVRGMGLDEFIANMNATQWEVDNRALEIAGRAEDLLADNHVENIAHIDIEKGDVDTYVLLVDSELTNNETAKSNSALSIEFGREGFIDPDTGDKWGQSDGLYILTRAANLPRKPRAKSKRTYLSKKAFFAAKGRRRKPGDE